LLLVLLLFLPRRCTLLVFLDIDEHVVEVGDIIGIGVEKICGELN
jgi:hypothetical protein